MASNRRWLSVVFKFFWSLRRRGINGTVQVALGKLKIGTHEHRAAALKPHPFDQRHGVDTGGLIAGTDLLTGHKHDAYNTAYWGISPSRARDLLQTCQNSLQTRSLAEYSFVDIGCGKGRMLLIASERPFREVIGVEFNKSLSEIASKNAIKWVSDGLAQCHIRVVSEDARRLSYQADCLIFIYNRLAPPVIEKMLAHLEEHFHDRAGELDILYLSREFEGVFQKHHTFKPVWKANFAPSDTDEPADVVAPGWQPCNAYRR